LTVELEDVIEKKMNNVKMKNAKRGQECKNHGQENEKHEQKDEKHK